MIKAHGAKVHIVSGSRDNCAEVCREAVEKEKLYYASHVYNPFFYQGTKTFIYEVYEQLGRIPENIFVPIGNGTLFLGVVKGLEELLASGCIKAMPHIIAVQSEHYDPLAESFRVGLDVPAPIVPSQTLAEGIAIGKPMRGAYILKKAYEYDMEFITAPESRIMEARALLAARGIYCEHTSAAVYAAYLKYRDENGPLRDCLLPMTGAGLKSDH
jgi:threonine synthase